jgi:hypothetical protein
METKKEKCEWCRTEIEAGVDLWSLFEWKMIGNILDQIYWEDPEESYKEVEMDENTRRIKEISPMGNI